MNNTRQSGGLGPVFTEAYFKLEAAPSAVPLFVDPTLQSPRLKEKEINYLGPYDPKKARAEEIEAQVKAFKADNKTFSECEKQYRELINSFNTFQHVNRDKINPPLLPKTVEATTRNFQTCTSHLFDNDGSYFGKSSHIAMAYGPVKGRLHELAHVLQNEKIPLQKRVDVILHLSVAMAACTGGMLTEVEHALHKLAEPTKGVKQMAYWQKENMVHNLTIAFIRATHQYESSNEVHFANLYFNYMASELGLKERRDELTSIAEPEVTAEALIAYRKFILKKMKPEHLATNMTRAALSNIAAAFDETKTDETELPSSLKFNVSGPIPPENLSGVMKEIENLILAEECGLTLMTEESHMEEISQGVDPGLGKVQLKNYLEEKEVGVYHLRAESQVIAAAMMHVLQKEKLIDYDMLSIGKTAEGDVMQLGEIFQIKGRYGCDEVELQDLLKISPEEIYNTIRENKTHEEAIVSLSNIAQHLLNEGEMQGIKTLPDSWLEKLCTALKGNLPDAEIDESGSTLAWKLAGNYNQPAILNSLWEKIPEDSRNSMWMDSAQKNHVAVMKLLIEKGVNINFTNAQGVSAAMRAAQNGHVEAVEDLIAAGADINLNDDKGFNAAIYAAEKGQVDVLKALIAAKADINLSDKKGFTTLMYAAKNGHIDAVEALIAAGANIDAHDNEGFSVAMHVAFKGHVDVIEALIKAGVNINVKGPKDTTAVILAAQQGHVNVLKALKAGNADFNAQLPSGFTAIMLAAQNGHVDAVKALISDGADVNSKNLKCVKVLMLAALNGHADVIKVLIDAGANIDAGDPEGVSALMYAVQEGHVDAVKALIAAGADLNAQNKDGFTALIYAAEKGQADVVEALISGGADMNLNSLKGVTAVMLAALKGHADVIKVLIDAGANINASNVEGFTALMLATDKGQADAVKALISGEADMNVKNSEDVTAAVLAAVNGHADVIKILIDAGANIDAKNLDGCTALMFATQQGHVDAVKALISGGADMNVNTLKGFTAVMLAAVNGYTDIIKVLIDAGANINAKNFEGFTALMFATDKGQADAVKALISGEADMNVKNSEDVTAAVLAAVKGHADVIKILIEAGANIDAKNLDGFTALMYATDKGQADAVKALISGGADMNVNTLKGFTAVMLAAVNGYTDIIKVLIDAGANINAQDENGFAALMHAAKKGHVDALKALIAAGADMNLKEKKGFSAAMHMALNEHIDVLKELSIGGADLSGIVSMFSPNGKLAFADVIQGDQVDKIKQRMKIIDTITVYLNQAMCKELLDNIKADLAPKTIKNILTNHNAYKYLKKNNPELYQDFELMEEKLRLKK